MEGVLNDSWFPIKMVTFVNPHFFFFKLDNPITGFEDEISKQLEEYTLESKIRYRSGYDAVENDFVAAYIVSWNKWVRAQVDLILPFPDSTLYVIWCFDYG